MNRLNRIEFYPRCFRLLSVVRRTHVWGFVLWVVSVGPGAEGGWREPPDSLGTSPWLHPEDLLGVRSLGEVAGLPKREVLCCLPGVGLK